MADRQPMVHITAPPPRQSGAAGYRVQYRVPGREAVHKSLLTSGIGGGFAAQSLFGSISGGFSRGMPTETLVDPITQEQWAAAGFNLLTTLCADNVLRVHPGPPEDTEEVPESDPWRQLFARPAKGMDTALWLKHLVRDIILSGECGLLLTDDGGVPLNPMGMGPEAVVDLPAQLLPVSGHRLLDRRDRDNVIRAWDVAPEQGRQLPNLHPGALQLVIEMPHHLRPGRGLGRMEQAWGAAAQSYLASRYNTVWLQNFGDPGGVIEVDELLPVDERDALETDIDDSWNNVERAGETRVLEGGAKWRESRARPRDMAFETLVKLTQDQVAGVIGMPGALLGQQAENYATFKGHLRVAMQMRVEPLLAAVCRRLRGLFLRQRDTRWHEYRVTFDTSALRLKLGDATEMGNAMVALQRGGVSPARSARIVGVELDPDTDLDVPLTTRANVPLAQLIGKSKAETLQAYLDARVAPAAAIRLAGLEGELLPEDIADPAPPPPMLAPPGAPDDGETDDPPDSETEDPDEDEDTEGTKAAARRLTRAKGDSSPDWDTSAARVREWNRIQEALRPRRRELLRRLGSVFWRMRAEQLQALQRFADTGELPDPGPPAERATWSGQDLRLPVADADALVRAALADAAEESARRSEDPEDPLLWSPVQDCGEGRRELAAFIPRQRVWMTRNQRFADAGVSLVDLRTVAYCMRAEVDPDELTLLLTVHRAKWSEELGEAILSQTSRAWDTMAGMVEQDWGMPMITTEAPGVLEAMSSKAIRVAEGTQSTLAARLRMDLSRALAEGGLDTSSLQAAVEGSLREVKAGTTRAFRTHKARAQAIAQTETMAASTEARWRNYARLQERGLIEGVRWITSGRGPEPEGTVRRSHYDIERNGEQINTDGRSTFSNGLRFPRDPAVDNGAEVVNCQCDLVAVRAPRSDED